MATRGRRPAYRRGGSSFRGGAGGPGQRRRGPGGPPGEFSNAPFQEAEELGSREIEVENKTFRIEVKSNDQGRFVKILESQGQGPGRGRVIFSIETAGKFRLILDEFVTEYESLGASADASESERLKTEKFNQGRRQYYVDLRQNQRGRFLKLTMLAGGKNFIALPGEGLAPFQKAFGELMDEFGVGTSSPPGTPPPDNLPNSREVRAGGKTFFFDVERNDRGVFVRLSEVVIRSGRRTHINIPHSCWSQIGDVFTTVSNELPFEESASGSGSEDEAEAEA